VGTPASRLQETQRVTMPPLPSLVTTEPRGLDVRSALAAAQGSAPAHEPESPPAFAPGVVMPPPPPPIFTPEPMRALGAEPLPPPVPDDPQHYEAPVEQLITAPREVVRPPGSRGGPPEIGAVPPRTTEPLIPLIMGDELQPPDESRRGLDDTHPSYQMTSSSGKPPEDTQPRVVLDEAAFRASEPTGEIVVGVAEEEVSISSPGRPKGPRRRAIPSGSQPGLKALSTPGRGGARSVEIKEDTPGSSEPEDSLRVDIEVEEGDEFRDPRENTRKTAMPNWQAEDERREQSENAVRSAERAPSGKRSLAWFVLSLALLAGAGAAVYFTLSRQEMEQLVRSMLGMEKPPPPPEARPITPPPQPVTAPTPATPPEATAPTSPSAPETAALPSPTPAPAETVAASEEPSLGSEEDLFPLPTPSQSTKKAPGQRTKKSQQVRSKEAIELQRDWNRTRTDYAKLTGELGCESPKLALLCRKFDDLKREKEELGDGAYDRDLHNRVKKLRVELQALVKTL